MADTKISGLPASTTPLAGTEVLPIVQSGTTKQVSVANLTAGRDVSANIFSSAAGAVATPAITTAGDTNTGFWFPAADTIAASTAGAERMRIDNAGNVGIGTTTPGAILDVRDNANGANFIVGGSGTLNLTKIGAGAADALAIYTNTSTEVMRLATTGVISLGAAPGSESLRVTPVASSVNYLNVVGSATGNGLGVSAQGTDTNINLVASSKGSGGVGSYTNNFANLQFNISHTASAVDYLNVTGSSAGFPSVSAQGTSANITIVYGSKGTGGHNFTTNGTSTNQFVVAHTASAVNYLQATGAATGGVPFITAAGSDTDIDLALTPKGTGVLKFGTHTAGIVAQAGYISIKDAGGTTRRLLVG